MFAIRTADSKDFNTMIKIMEESTTDEEVRGFVRPEGISPKFLKELKGGLEHSDHGIIIAERRGIPIGFAYYIPKNDSVEIEEVNIMKKYQGQGAGMVLIKYIEKVAREKGMSRLVTGVSINRNGKPWKAYRF
jgi:N-acetylglutamate synthase-like GNAT family acetyltransferase